MKPLTLSQNLRVDDGDLMFTGCRWLNEPRHWQLTPTGLTVTTDHKTDLGAKPTTDSHAKMDTSSANCSVKQRASAYQSSGLIAPRAHATNLPSN